MAVTPTKSIDEHEKYLNEKYKIKTYTYAENDVDILKGVFDNKFDKNPSWKREWMDDHLLIRFLRSFDNVVNTTDKLVEYFDWRVKSGIDDVNFEDPIMRDIKALGVNLILDDIYDKCGRPIMIIYTGRQCKDNERAEYLLKSALYFIERLCEKSDETEMRNFTIVFDFNGFGMQNMDYNFLQSYINCLKNYYPHRLAAALIVNYPSIVYPLWQGIKYWMDKHLRDRFIFCTKKEFNDFIDCEKLPVRIFPE